MRALVAGRVDGTLWSLRTRLPRRTPPRPPRLSATVPYEYILWCCVTSSTTISVGTTNSARGGRYRHRHVQSAGLRPRPATGAPGCGPEPGGASARVRPAPHVYILAGARPQRADAAHCVDHCPRRWPAPVGVGRAGRIGHRFRCDARVTAGWRCDTGRGGALLIGQASIAPPTKRAAPHRPYCAGVAQGGIRPAATRPTPRGPSAASGRTHPDP